MANYAQHRFPYLPAADGSWLEVRINDSSPYWNGSGSAHTGIPSYTVGGTWIIEHDSQPIIGITPKKQGYSSRDGLMSLDAMEVTFENRRPWRYTTVAAPTPVAEETSTYLLDHIFTDEDATYYLMVMRHADPSDPTDGEIVFVGTFDPRQVFGPHGPLVGPHTSSEEAPTRQVKLTAVTLANYRDTTVEDLIATFTESDMIAGGATVPFFGGYVIQPELSSLPDVTNSIRDDLTINYADDGITASSWDDYFDVACYRHYDGLMGAPVFPNYCYGVAITTILEKIANVTGSLITIPDDFSPAFEAAKNRFVSTSAGYDSTVYASTSELAVCYNYEFGVAPYDGSEFTSPISFRRDTSMLDVLKEYAIEFGCRLQPEIDQDIAGGTAGLVRLRLLSRREPDSTGLPAAWTLLSSQDEQPELNTTTHVKVHNRGSEGAILCSPTGRFDGEAIEIEIRHRVRPFGAVKGAGASAHIWWARHLMLNDALKYYQQYRVFDRYDDSDTEGNPARINADSWLPSAFLYEYHATDTNVAYNTNATNDGTWAGFYMLRQWLPKTTVPTAQATKYENTLYATAQFYARELLGNKYAIRRRYFGITDASGNVGTIIPGIECSFQYRGSVRTFRAVEIETDFIKAETEILWIEKPDYDALTDYPTRTDGEFKSTGSASSGGGSGVVGDTPIGTGSGGIGGSGTTNYIAKFTPDGTHLGNSQMTDDGTKVQLNSAATNGKLNVGNSTIAIWGETSGGSASNVGVEGYAPSGGTGTKGLAAGGRGVHGEATSGTGVYATASTGKALEVVRNNAAPTGAVAEISQTNAGDAQITLDVQQAGTGKGFRVLHTASSGAQTAAHIQSSGGQALYVTTTSTEIAANIERETAGSSNPVVKVLQSGTGTGGCVELSDASTGTTLLIDAATRCIKATTIDGQLAWLRRDSADGSPSSPGVLVELVSTNDNAHGVKSEVNGTGSAVYARNAADGTAVNAQATTGSALVAARNNAAPNYALLDIFDSNTGSHTQPAVLINQWSNTAPALYLEKGRLRHQATYPAAPVTLTTGQQMCAVDTSTAPITITLPPVASCLGSIYRIMDGANNAAINAITVVPNGTDTFLSGGASKTITVNNEELHFVGTNVGGTPAWKVARITGA